MRKFPPGWPSIYVADRLGYSVSIGLFFHYGSPVQWTYTKNGYVCASISTIDF